MWILPSFELAKGLKMKSMVKPLLSVLISLCIIGSSPSIADSAKEQAQELRIQKLEKQVEKDLR